MNYIKILSVALFPACLSIACSNSTANAGKSDSGAALPKTEVSSNTTTSSGDASFSCKIDGKDYSGKGTDQIINAASVHAPGILYFNLSSSFTGDLSSDLRVGGFGFEVPDHGTTVIKGVEAPDYNIAYSLPNDLTNTYSCKEMTITINSSGTRVTGTFSGTLIEPKTSRAVPVTDGKFDIPMSTYGKQ